MAPPIRPVAGKQEDTIRDHGRRLKRVENLAARNTGISSVPVKNANVAPNDNDFGVVVGSSAANPLLFVGTQVILITTAPAWFLYVRVAAETRSGGVVTALGTWKRTPLT